MSLWSSSQRHEFLRHPPPERINLLILLTDTHLDAISSRLKCMSQTFVCLMFSCLYFARWHSINSTFFSKPKPSFCRLGALVNLALGLWKELYVLYNKVQTSQQQESQIRPCQKTDLQRSEEKNMEERHDDGNILVETRIIIVYWWWCAGLYCIQKLQNCP